MLRIFTSVKIQRLWAGLNPRTWVPEASMLTTRPPKPYIAGVNRRLVFVDPWSLTHNFASETDSFCFRYTLRYKHKIPPTIKNDERISDT